MAVPRAPLRGVLFDLDDTLFDHTHATRHALAALHADEPRFACWSHDELERRHAVLLEAIHREVPAGRVTIDVARRERFGRLLDQTGGHRSLPDDAARLAAAYRGHYENAWQAVDGAVDLLTALKTSGLAIAIVTNNLRAEQVLKLRRCGLDAHVDVLITSEDEGVAKPHVAIFQAALKALGIEASEAAMVGDAWDTDIAGAIAAGLQPVWFNRHRQPQRDRAVLELVSLTPVDAARRIIVGEIVP